MPEVCLAGWAEASRYPGEPLDAWATALRATGVASAQIDSLDVVYCQSWPYDDPAGRLAQAIGAAPRRLHYSGIGGTTPIKLIAQAAERVALGEASVCAIVGGEALATVRRLKKAGQQPDWSYRDPAPKPMPFEAPFQPSEVAHGLRSAVSTFALRDIARRAALKRGVLEYRQDMGELFAAMTNVAAVNSHAWFSERATAAELIDVTAQNRMVSFPYTKRLVSIMDVDLASAVIVTSPEAAAAMGLARDQLVWIAGWGSGRDPEYVAEHADLARSPGMSSAFEAALQAARISIEDIGHLDLYSCFPSAVSFALDALGLKPNHRLAPFTVTGGLSYAGGPGSAYALGAVAATADRLIGDSGAYAMTTAIGMHLSRHAGLILRSAPVEYRGGIETIPHPPPRKIADHHQGAANVAAYTVVHAPDGRTSHALLVCDIDDGARCYARSDDPAFLEALEAEEWVGRRVTLEPQGNVNVARP